MAPASDPGLDASAPPPDPPPSSAVPPPLASKRRWSPCTWRYAIEEFQPELSSRPRSGSNLLYAGISASSSLKSRSHHHHPHEHPYADDARRSFAGSRHEPVAETRHSIRAEERYKSKKRQQNHHYAKESPKQSPKEDGEADEEEQGRHRRDEDGAYRARLHENASSKRQKREMSPSELYFCEICAAKYAAVTSSKANGGTKSSPSPASDDAL